MNYVEVCPVQIVSGSCPEPLVWREVASTLPLTYEQFLIMVPAFVTVLLSAWGFRKLLTFFFNR